MSPGLHYERPGGKYLLSYRLVKGGKAVVVMTPEVWHELDGRPGEPPFLFFPGAAETSR